MSAKTLLKIKLLGSFSIEPPSSKTMRRKTRALLAYLVGTSSAHTRQHLIHLFAQEADSPSRVLTLLLSRLRSHLGANTVRTESGTIALDVAGIDIDYLSFRQVLSAPLAEKSTEMLRTAVKLYQGEFMDALTLTDAPEFELWLMGERTHARRLLERGLKELGDRSRQNGRYEEAIQLAQQQLQLNPLLEEAHQQLIWLYAQLGQTTAALQQYEHCRTLLQRELAVEPSKQLQILYQEIVTGQIRPAIQPLTHLEKPTTPPSDPPKDEGFVGRQEILAHLHHAWQAAQTGQTGITILTAEAGGGKSRLMHTFIGQLETTHMLHCRCFESTNTVPYYPWLEFIEQHLTQLNEAEIEQLPPFTKTLLGRLIPHFSHHLKLTEPQITPTIRQDDQYILTTLVDFFIRIVAQRPLLLFIDDLQWADPQSIPLFSALVQRAIARQAKVLIITALRPEEAERNPIITQFINDIRHLRPQSWQPIPQFTAAEIDQLISLRGEQTSAQQAKLSRQLIGATGGNPLFVTELLNEISGTQTLPETLPIPQSLTHLLDRRLAELTTSGQQVIEVLALLDTAASLDMLQHISGRSEDEVVNALDEGITHHLLQASPSTPHTPYRFYHDLMQEAVIQQMTTARRQLLHRRIASYLGRIRARQSQAERRAHAQNIVQHAQQGQHHRLIFAWAPTAAEQALQLYAYKNALIFYEMIEKAFEHVQLSPDFDPHTAAATLIESFLRRLEILDDIGGTEQEKETLDQKAADWLEKYPHKGLEAHHNLVRTELLWDSAQYKDAINMVTRAHQQFVTLGLDHMAARSYLRYGHALLASGRNEEAATVLNDALLQFQSLDDLDGYYVVTDALVWFKINVGHFQRAIDLSLDTLETAQKQQNLPVMGNLAYALLVLYAIGCHRPRQEAYAQKALAFFEQVNYVPYIGRTKLSYASFFGTQGNRAKENRYLQDALAIAIESSDLWAEGWAHNFLGRNLIELGRFEEAEAHLLKALDMREGMVQSYISDLSRLGRLKLLQEDAQTADFYTTKAIDLLENHTDNFYVMGQPDVYFCRAQVLYTLKEEVAGNQLIRTAYNQLLAFAQQFTDPDIYQAVMQDQKNRQIIRAYKRIGKSIL